jgi:transposase
MKEVCVVWMRSSRRCSVIFTLSQRVDADHPLRWILSLVDQALASMDADFENLDSSTGRPSIAPERLLGAQLSRKSPIFISLGGPKTHR